MTTARVVLRPLPHGWVDPVTPVRQPTPFKAGWDDTTALLAREAEMLGAPEAVVQLDVPDDMTYWRIDGGLRASYVPLSPGVVVSLSSKHGPLRYACDAFRLPRDGRESWQANVRAVALALESLRRVSRYGIGTGTEQYTGFAQLGTGTALGAPVTATMSTQAAARFLAGWSEMDYHDILLDRTTAKRAYHKAWQRLHPDTTEGETTPELFQELSAARAALEI